MTRRSKVGLALAGGGPLGAIYEIGALCALDEALHGASLTTLDHYVGVSAGSFVAAALANGITPRELCRAFIESDTTTAEDVFDPAWLMVPAYREWLRRLAGLPRIAALIAWDTARRRMSLQRLAERLAPALPTGVFSNHEVDRRLAQVFSRPGRSNDFRQLRTQLTIVATDLDCAEAVAFGRAGWDHVPISRAVQASCALPGLFPPVDIEGRSYVDGALKKTLHASVALDAGVDLLLCVNPLVPYRAGGGTIPRIADGGLAVVLSQTFRSLIHSRMAQGMKHYERAYPHATIVLFEPDPADTELYLANTFGYGQRRQLAEHAYQQTRRALRARGAQLAAQFGPHGLSLDADVLHDATRRLVAAPRRPVRLGQAVESLQAVVDELGTVLQSPRFGGGQP